MAGPIYIGTSGWHYTDWLKTFYPADVKGYHELTFHAHHFTTVENNSSFYRIASESAYKTWDRMTPPGYKFSLKLNRSITHLHRLSLTEEVQHNIEVILTTTQALENKLGAIVIQLPASFHADHQRLRSFLAYFTTKVREKPFPFDISIEFRHASWLTDETYGLLKHHNIALVVSQSSRWPGVKELTADFAYLRFHGPRKLFASSYSQAELEEWATYIRYIRPKCRHIYIYFNNDFHAYAIKNALTLKSLLEL